MNASPWFRAVLVLSGWLALAGGAQAQVGWLQLSPDCQVDPDAVQPGGIETPQIVACGDAGSFVFGQPGVSYKGCVSVADGTEAPAPIPVEPAPSLPQGFPCAQGSCLHHTAGNPWVALVDWRTEHGWSVAATIQEASDQRVEVQLYDLASVGSIAQWVPSVSDAHVLVQLCALAEAVRLHPKDRPLAVNLSFGRRRTGDCSTSPSDDLSCAVESVLGHLADAGVVPIAAAGNHHELLFPASSPGVISAGSLDLSHLRYSREVRPSTQTAPDARALMSGYGLYLSYTSTSGDAALWPAPPGSSYAAAVLSGWLGGTLARGGDPLSPLLKGGRWEPLRTAKGLALAVDGEPLPGSELTGPRLLLERALAGRPPFSLSKGDVATLWLTGEAPPLPELPVLYASEGNDPQPGVNPCVPCQGGGGQGGAPEGPETVVVDLSSSAALPPGTDLVAVFLRVGDSVWAFDGSREPALLAEMAAGELQGLALAGVGNVFQPDEQPSLVLVVNVGGTAYWHEVPLNVPE
jgi:hypothetical protein